jgi:hypothetical protein
VAINNPLTTFVVAGSRITVDRSVIGLLQCGQAQLSYSKMRRKSSALHVRCSARSLLARRSSTLPPASAQGSERVARSGLAGGRSSWVRAALRSRGANGSFSATDRGGLERLCRYVLRRGDWGATGLRARATWARQVCAPGRSRWVASRGSPTGECGWG